MDKYTEQILEKKPGMKQKMFLIAAILVILVGVYFCLFIDIGSGTTIIIVGAFLVYLAKMSFNTEYEYLFINGDCDIAKIKNKASRKNVFSFKESEIQKVWEYSSLKFQNELEINSQLKVKNFTSGLKENSDKWYGFFTSGEAGTQVIILELDEKSREHISECYKKKMD